MFSISELLFKTSGRVIKCANKETKTGVAAALGVGCSDARSHRSVRKDTKAKVSRLAVILDKIFEDKNLSLASFNEGAIGYAEYTDGGVVFSGTYDGIKERWLRGNIPESATARLAPIFSYAVANCPETSMLLEQLFVEKESGADKLSYERIVTLCDAFYYEYAVDKTDNIDVFGDLSLEELKQVSRTNGINNITKNSFANISIKESSLENESVASSGNSEWEAIKSGSRFIGYDWNAEQMKKIPSLTYLDKFVPSAEYYDLLAMISGCAESVLLDIDSGISEMDAIKAHYVNSILVGKPGTGKTSVAYALGASLGVPVYTVTNSRNTEEDNYEGKNKVVEGKISFCPTPFLEAYKNGGIIVLEEFNLVSPDVLMGAIGQAVEAPFILMEDGYKEVRRHPLCFILATMNTCTQGSKEPNEAFTSRFPDVFLMDDPSHDDFVKILMSAGNEKYDSEAVYNAYGSIIGYLTDNSYDDVAMSITLRHCLAALNAIKRGIPFKNAIKRTMVNAIGVKDIALAKEVYETVVEPLAMSRRKD